MTALALEFVIDGPPQPKQRARHFVRSSGKMGSCTPRATRQYERAVQVAAWAAQSRAGVMQSWPMDARYRLSVRAYFADQRRRDLDNVFKAVADGLNGALYRDDAQVIDAVISKRVSKAAPRTVVRIEVVDTEESDAAE